MIHTYQNTPRMTPLERFHVEPLVQELDQHSTLWGEHPHRTLGDSPHREIQDIWARYNDFENLGPKFADEHESVWYPCSEKIPSIREFVERFASQKGAKTIGGVLITRIPPKKQVYWHTDSGWHAQAHRKFIVLLRANEEQSFEFQDESLRAITGDCFEFQNEFAHRVLNPSDCERISLIICLRDFA